MNKKAFLWGTEARFVRGSSCRVRAVSLRAFCLFVHTCRTKPGLGSIYQGLWPQVPLQCYVILWSEDGLYQQERTQIPTETTRPDERRRVAPSRASVGRRRSRCCARCSSPSSLSTSRRTRWASGRRRRLRQQLPYSRSFLVTSSPLRIIWHPRFSTGRSAMTSPR